jgi:UDP-galactopyranose mutase
MAQFDYVVVGCGMFGAVFARSSAEQGKRVLVVDKRDHVAGNCHTESVAGITVHRYGPHIFHTNHEGVWRFLNRFARFNHYTHHGRAFYRGRVFSFPINLMTLEQLWGVHTPEEAARKLQSVRRPIAEPGNLRDWIISQVGEELYEIFVHGYTKKQWGRDPAELPASIIRRIPIRNTFDDRYFGDRFQGVPIGGYTRLFENMLDHDGIEVALGIDYFSHAQELSKVAGKTVYTGKVDEFFDYRFGELEYRSLRFETEVRQGDFQGAAIMNYTEEAVPYTRITEHKHFEYQQSDQTVITREYPAAYQRGQTPYYPIRDSKNLVIYQRYQCEAERAGVLFGGRLASYQYFDMDQVVGQALAMARRESVSREPKVPRRAAA